MTTEEDHYLRCKTNLTLEEVMQLKDVYIIPTIVGKGFYVAVNLCWCTTQLATLDYRYRGSSQYHWDINRIDHLNQQEYSARIQAKMRSNVQLQTLRGQVEAAIAIPSSDPTR